MEKGLVCQSCSMPIEQEEHIGTNSDGSKNRDYCAFCFKDGNFTDNMGLEEFIENSLQFASQIGMSKEQMKEHCEKTLPTLKRWKQN